MASIKNVVGIDDVIRAIRIRESGGSWHEVIAATGFNGATLRPHITEYLQREVLGRPAVESGDRVDSPYAVVQPVEITTESIDDARRRGMAFYSIAKALGISEAKVKGLCSPQYRGRQYAGVKGRKQPGATGNLRSQLRIWSERFAASGIAPAYENIAAAATATAEQARKDERNRKARERRAAKKAAA